MSDLFRDLLKKETPAMLDGFSDDDLTRTYSASELLRRITTQRSDNQEPAALFTDIDKTFYRIGKEDASRALYEKMETKGWPIIVVTGNDLAEVVSRIEKKELPAFHAIVGSVGTELWVLHQKNGELPQYEQDIFYDRLLKKSGFDRSGIVRSARAMINDFSRIHPEWKFDFQHPEKERQPGLSVDVTYQPFKVSFYFFAVSEAAGVRKVTEAVRSYFPNQSLVTCGEVDYNSQLSYDEPMKKYCLDILATTKSGAVQYLRQLLGITRGIIAGDSGNDVDMLLESSPLTAVLVGGYEPYARSAIEAAANHGVYVDQDLKRQAAESILWVGEYTNWGSANTSSSH